MTPFLHKLLRAGFIVATVWRRLWKSAEVFFLTKDEIARRAWKAREAERLDRLRNPSNYQGR
jgi:hypothetical protein